MYVSYVVMISILCQPMSICTFSSHSGTFLLVLLYAVLCISAGAENELEQQMYSCNSTKSLFQGHFLFQLIRYSFILLRPCHLPVIIQIPPSPHSKTYLFYFYTYIKHTYFFNTYFNLFPCMLCIDADIKLKAKKHTQTYPAVKTQ